IRQYFIESDREKVPFSRQQRAVVYQRAKGASDKRPFGTQLDPHSAGHEWINHSWRASELSTHDFRIVIGDGGTSCTKPYAASLFNISAMSFGALSARAILALNAGAHRGGFAHDTGEGSISEHHRVHGGDLIWEIGSGYFGCRDAQGRFDEAMFGRNASLDQVKMIEVKLSQGAKPGHGGVLPGLKVSEEIAAARGVPVGVDCVSPANHSAFSTPAELMYFIERLRGLSGGKPVGIKLCIGHPWEWFALCQSMLDTGLLPDFIVIDGSEGGTGAAPLEFTDHLGMPLRDGLLLAHDTLTGLGLRSRIRIGCAGKIVGAFDIARALCLGADWCNAARGFMFAIGCIQAQTCHSGNCPTGVTTQDPWRQRALDVHDKSERVWRYHEYTLQALKELVQAAGLLGPGELRAGHLMRRMESGEVRTLAELHRFVEPGALLRALDGTGPWPHGPFQMHWPMAGSTSAHGPVTAASPTPTRLAGARWLTP
ncbi:MAG: hypothetical protein RI988_2976, partial [Pseudomonadota bacterium]